MNGRFVRRATVWGSVTAVVSSIFLTMLENADLFPFVRAAFEEAVPHLLVLGVPEKVTRAALSLISLICIVALLIRRLSNNQKDDEK